MTKSSNNTFIAGVIRWASLALFIAIALRTMGIANEIVELAFGLILGAIAVAVALSYGLGGREAAGEHFKDIVRKMRSEAADIPAERTPDTSGDRPIRSGNAPLNPRSNRPDGGSTSPGRNPENPDRPSRGPSNPDAPRRGPENPDGPFRGPENPDNPGTGPVNPNKPGEGPEDPTEPPLI